MSPYIIMDPFLFYKIQKIALFSYSSAVKVKLYAIEIIINAAFIFTRNAK